MIAAGLSLAASAFAQSAEDTAEWLNRIGAKHIGKPFTAALVESVDSLGLYGVDFSKVTPAEIGKLSAMTKLRDIAAPDPRLGDAIVVALAKLPNPSLTEIDLYRTGIGDVGVAALAARKNLIGIGLEGTRIGAAGLKQLATLPQLKMLRLGETAVDDEGLENLRAAPALTELGLQGASGITRKGWAALGRIATLESLNLRAATIDADFAALAPATRLRHLTLTRAKIDDASGRHLGQLKALRWLFLANTRIADASMPGIASLPDLHTLQLSGTAVGDDGLKALAEARSLHTLSLDGTRITDAGLLHLAKIETLAAVSLRKTAVTDGGIEKFRALRPKVRVSK